MKKIQYNGSSKILIGIVTKINLIIDKLVVDVKVNGTSVIVVNEEGEREADIDLSLADQNVKQSPTTSSDNADYRVLLSKSANDTEETDISRKDTNLKYNPSTGNLQTTKLNGNTVPSGSGNDTLAKTSDIPDMTNYIQKSLTVGLIKNDGTIDQTQYATMSDIPDELADLADDEYHRLVTDAEKSAWDDKADKTDVDKAELNTWNLLRQPYFHGSGTSSGTTRTVNADGSVTFTGTATANFNFNFKRYTQEWKLPKGKYRIIGCPVGGSDTTYFLRVQKYTTSLATLATDYGYGAEFTLTEETTMHIVASIISGYAIQDSLTFKPSIIPIEKVEQNEVAPIENGDTASQVYTIGDYMFWKGGFYVVIAAISSGDAIAVNTNVAKTYIGDEIANVRNSITSAINDLDVPSTSIAAGETLATIKEDNGKIAVTKQDIKIGLGQIDNFYRCGTNNAISGSNTWHKVASATPPAATNTDYTLMLAVNDNYLSDTDNNISDAGILYCRVRQATSGGVDSVSYAELKFVSNSGLNPSNFRLYHKTDTNGITFEIWTSMNRRYAWRRLSVISQGDRTSVYSNSWTMYNSTSPSSAPTESATCIRVECEDNTYKQTDNDTLGATNLIPYPYSGGSNASRNNVTISVNENGVITASGNAPSSGFGYSVASRKETIVLDPSKSYIMSGMTNGSGSTVRFLLDLWTASQNPTTDSYTTRLYQATTETTIPSGYKYLQISLYFYTGAASLFPLTVSPMLRLASIADSTFKTYADTNRNLSMNKANLRQIATVELTNTASKAYDVGDYMIWENKLCVVRVEIASGGAITSGTNVEATDIGSEVKKSKIWGNENIATIPNSSSSSKVYVTTSAYATEIYVQRMNIRSTSLGINETGYCSVTIPILPSMTNNYFVFMFRGDIDNKLYDGRLLFQKDSNGVYGYVSKVYQDGVLKSANDLEADIVVFEKS